MPEWQIALKGMVRLFFFLALSVNNNDCNAITVLQFIQLSLKSCHPAFPALDFPHQKDE